MLDVSGMCFKFKLWTQTVGPLSLRACHHGAYTCAETSYLNTVLTDTEGLPIYKIETSPGLTFSRTTTISKFLLESNNLKEFAKITWHWMASSKLQFRGKEVDLDTYVAGEAHHTYRQ